MKYEGLGSVPLESRLTLEVTASKTVGVGDTVGVFGHERGRSVEEGMRAVRGDRVVFAVLGRAGPGDFLDLRADALRLPSSRRA